VRSRSEVGQHPEGESGLVRNPNRRLVSIHDADLGSRGIQRGSYQERWSHMHVVSGDRKESGRFPEIYVYGYM
jgi:hypothetical protein